MATITKINNLSKTVRKIYKNKDELVLVPLTRYNRLLEKIEELEDIKDHIESIKDYQTGKGKDFRDFLNEHKEKFDV